MLIEDSAIKAIQNMMRERQERYKKLESFHGKKSFTKKDILNILKCIVPGKKEDACYTNYPDFNHLISVEKDKGFNDCIEEITRVVNLFEENL